MIKVRPLGDRVVLSPDGIKDKTESGLIIIPQSAQDTQPRTGRVFGLGPGKLLESGRYVAPPVEVGDRVLFDKYGATGYKEHGEDFIIVDCGALLGVFDDE